jgi:hypothetical protein
MEVLRQKFFVWQCHQETFSMVYVQADDSYYCRWADPAARGGLVQPRPCSRKDGEFSSGGGGIGGVDGWLYKIAQGTVPPDHFCLELMVELTQV